MKLTSAIFIGLLATVSASPTPRDVDLLLAIKVEDKVPGVTQPLLQTASSQNICLKVCWPETPKCPDGWFSNNFGTLNQPCWTCCKSPDAVPTGKTNKDKQNFVEAAPSKDVFAANQDICFLICLPEAPQCPNNWQASQKGDCWTCCRSNSEIIHAETASKVATKFVQGSPSMVVFAPQQDICLLVCLPEAPQCPHGWYSSEKGSCWTCCKSPNEDYAAITKSTKGFGVALIEQMEVSAPTLNENKVQAPKEIDNSSQNICLKVCWPETPKCPDGWFSNNFGTLNAPCWTCCKSPDLVAAAEL